MSSTNHWLPPGKNCGLCGAENCKSFLRLLQAGKKTYEDCPYFHKRAKKEQQKNMMNLKKLPIHLMTFWATPMTSSSTLYRGKYLRVKSCSPFVVISLKKWRLFRGDLVLGRPMGAGCPIPHVLKVIKAEPVTGLLYTWVVGPQYSRERQVKDVVAYHMIGFEGIATAVRKRTCLWFTHDFPSRFLYDEP